MDSHKPPTIFYIGQSVAVVQPNIFEACVKYRDLTVIKMTDLYVEINLNYQLDRRERRWRYDGSRYGSRMGKPSLGKPAGYFDARLVPSHEVPPPPRPVEPGILDNDQSIAAAFTRLLSEPALARVDLSQWEFEFACEAPAIYQKWGSFTWKQRRRLREIAMKLGVPR